MSLTSARSTLAPHPELVRYLELLRDALLCMRNLGLGGGKDEASFCGHLADALENLPDLLLRHQEFDQDRFWREARALRTVVPSQFRQTWDHLFRER